MEPGCAAAATVALASPASEDTPLGGHKNLVVGVAPIAGGAKQGAQLQVLPVLGGYPAGHEYERGPGGGKLAHEVFVAGEGLETQAQSRFQSGLKKNSSASLARATTGVQSTKHRKQAVVRRSRSIPLGRPRSSNQWANGRVRR